MAKQTVNLGTVADDGTGDTLRDGGDKINDNFDELYGMIDTDGTLAANSDAKIATQKAVKTYVASQVVGLFDPKGATDCSANPNYPAALKGDLYLVSVAGKIGGASGKVVTAGDVYIAFADNAGGTEASVGTSWQVIEGNIAYTPVNKAGDTMSGDLIVPDEAYDATAWDGSLEVPTKNAVRDKIEALAGGGFTAASTSEQLTGTDSAKGSTSDSVAALWEQGADVASAGTISLGEGGYFNITGTTTITDIDFATDKAGRKAWVQFAGILTLTHNASTLILPTGANITTAAGDTACFVSEGSDVVRCVAYNRASGAALAGSSSDLGALHVYDSKASGTAGGTSTANQWHERLYNTTALNTISGAAIYASTVTMTIASPGVITWTGHTLLAGAAVILTTSGALPTGFTAGTIYYVVSPAANTFQLAATPGGAAINTTGSQSGTHTATTGQITLPAGTYDMRGWANMFATSSWSCAIRFWNATDGTAIFTGSSHFGTSEWTNHVQGRFVLAAQKNVSMQTIAASGSSGNGLGADAAITGVNNHFANLFIKRAV